MTYSYEDAFQASLSYFRGEELPAKVFVDKYALRNNNGEILESTPDDMHKRLAKEFARIEAGKFKRPLSEETIYNLFKGFKKLIPQGSPMTAIGNPYQIMSVSNCFVTAPPEDSYGGICKTDEHIVQISKRRGGIGYDISKLRPKGMSVQNSSRTTTGCVSFMHRFSHSGREVGQGGRRGAQMQTISVHHPDIMDFIIVKNDEVSVTGANISIRLTDEFLNAVENNSDYELRWPVEGEAKIKQTISAKDVWNAIIHNAWLRAEPGLLFWDHIIRESVPDCYANFKSTSTNPCMPSYAKVLTKDGIRTIREVDIGSEIWSKEGWTKITKKWPTGKNEVYQYETTAGRFIGTKNHFVVSGGDKIDVGLSEQIDVLNGPYQKLELLNNSDIMDGLLIGDGSVHKASNNLVILYIGKDDSDYFNCEITHLIKEHRPGIKETAYEVSHNLTYEELPKTFNRKVPDRYLFGDKDKKFSFLRGLYSANGSVCGNRITLKSASIQLIRDVQSMLSSLGIASYYTTNKSAKIKFDNGEYQCKQSYDLNISVDRAKFVESIGFIQQYKNEQIKIVGCGDKPKKTSYDIKETTFLSIQDTFDISVDNESHTFWTDGLNVFNCGEIILSNYDSCRLLAINLFGYVINPFTDKAVFDYESFYDDVTIGQRLMDDLVDLELEQINKILEKIDNDKETAEIKRTEKELWELVKRACVEGRRTGLGITGLGDTLAASGIKYGSNESIYTTEQIYKYLKFAAYRSSVDMAKELGTFPAWNHELEKDNPFLLRIDDEEIRLFDCCIEGCKLYEDMKKYGRRNIALLTTAPTGSLSIMASILNLFNITSGIEPVYALATQRSKKVNHSDENVKVDFVDKLGDKWTKFNVYHSGLALWLKANPGKTEEDSPYFGSTAEDINWVQRVKLQAAAQKHIDHSISSTINLPKDVSEEEVAKIYITAWKAGCKGITVYRDGCRSGVITKKQEEAAPSARPKELPCNVHHITVKGKSYFVLVGLMNDKPYEVFAGKNGFLKKAIDKGTIIRKNKNYYKALFDDDTELSPITASCNEYEEAITRLTSALLRSGADMHLIVQQLEKVNGEMHSFAKSVARALKTYIPDGTLEVGESCPECLSENIVRESGCQTCKSCGWSKCN